MRLKRVGVLSVALTSGALYVVFGLIAGAFIALLTTVAGSLASMAGEEAGEASPILGMIFGFGALFFFPVFYGVLGFLGGALVGALYNLIAKLTGGIELTLE